MGIFRNIMFLIAFAGSSTCQEPPRPHIVFIYADDLGWGDVSLHGSKLIPTPNIDALARDGIILNQYYVQAICSPSRGALMTGKYPIHLGFQYYVITADEPWGLPLKEKILPQYLKDLGYSTHAIGKWHLGFFKEAYVPQKRGFDSFFGYYAEVEDYYTHIVVRKNYTGLDLHENDNVAWQYRGIYGTELYTYKATKIIQEHDSTEPLFLYLAQQAPHSGIRTVEPIQVPEKYVRPLVGIKDEKRRQYAGMVLALDISVGEVFDALEKSGMLNNTIFIFSTDNGGAPEGFDKTRSSNYPLRGTKFNLWEGGTRGTAFIWSPLLRRQSGIYNGLMHVTDWVPTLLSAVGGQNALRMLPGIDGTDHWPSLTKHLPSPREEILLNIDNVNNTEGIRKGNFKLLKGSYFEGKYDGWYDSDGLPIRYGYVPPETPTEKRLYNETYERLLRRSKAAQVLQQKYGVDPRSAAACKTRECQQQLEVDCGPRPIFDNCNPNEGYCLFDLNRDPCELYNIAKEYPQITDALKLSLDKYRPSIVPAGNKPSDPRSNPKLHGNVWIPWL